MKVSELIEALQNKHSPDDEVMVIVSENKPKYPVTVLDVDDQFASAAIKVLKLLGSRT